MDRIHVEFLYLNFSYQQMKRPRHKIVEIAKAKLRNFIIN